MSGRKIHPDALAVKRCVLALEKCTSTDAIRAAVEYLWDRYMVHPTEAYKTRRIAERDAKKVPA